MKKHPDDISGRVENVVREKVNANRDGGFAACQEKGKKGRGMRTGTEKSTEKIRGFFAILVGRGRLERPTNGLKVRCSTN